MQQSGEALGLPGGQGMEEDMAAGAVVPTGSFFKKKKKKNQRNLGRTRLRPPQWPATWAGRLRCCPLPPAAGPGLWFHFATVVSVSSWRERRTALGRQSRAGQVRGAPSAVPGAPGPRSGPQLAQLFSPQPSALRLGVKVKRARSDTNWEARLTCGPVPPEVRVALWVSGHSPSNTLKKSDGFPREPPPHPVGGAGRRPRQNRMWVTEVSQLGTLLVQSPPGWKVLKAAPSSRAL